MSWTCGRDDRAADVAPVRVREDRRDRVGEERDRHQHEDRARPTLYEPRTTSSQTTQRGDRHGHLHRDVGEAERRADADELADADAEVRDQHRARREERPANAVLLADQLGEALAGHRAHPRRHLLDDDQRDGDHAPSSRAARSRTCAPTDAVGRDPAGVVAGVRGDQARAEDREQATRRRWRGYAAAAAAPAGPATATGSTY